MSDTHHGQLRILQAHLAALMEHFSSCHIVAVRHDAAGRSAVYHSGRGSYYERVGAVQESLRMLKSEGDNIDEDDAC